MRSDDVGEIHAAVEKLVGLHVGVCVGGARRGLVVGLGKEARRPQHDAGQAVVALEQLAQVLGSRLRHAVDVARHGRDVLGHPRRGRSRRRRERAPERARRAGVDEGAHSRGGGFLEQVERAREIGVDERLAGVRGDVRLVQRRRVQDGLHAGHAAPDHARSAMEPTALGVGGRQQIETDRFVPLLAQRPHQGFAEVPRAAGDQQPHRLNGTPIHPGRIGTRRRKVGQRLPMRERRRAEESRGS